MIVFTIKDMLVPRLRAIQGSVEKSWAAIRLDWTMPKKKIALMIAIAVAEFLDR